MFVKALLCRPRESDNQGCRLDVPTWVHATAATCSADSNSGKGEDSPLVRAEFTLLAAEASLSLYSESLNVLLLARERPHAFSHAYC